MNYCYRFPVVKGVQAKKEYYIGMVPLKMIASLFPRDDEYIMPEHRAQRKLNESRIPEIANYILENRDSYVFSALAASIDGEFRFVPSEQEDVGILEVALDARFLINDGQHRKAAILEAISEDPSLMEETISVVFFEDSGLERSQQMFTDLNKHAVKTSNSISELYDSRDDLAVVTRKIVKEIPFLDEYVDKEKDILGKYSSSLFTLNNMYNANRRILKRRPCNEVFEEFCLKYWQSVSSHMIPWGDLKNRDISKMELREKYIATQAVIIQALGRVGGYLIEHQDEYDVDKAVSKLETIDWKRTAPEWVQRVIKPNGRMITSEKAILLAANNIKKRLELPLTDDEMIAEQELTI
ncbi:DNA sulfur modification protein DndB [Butyrivibrio sp. Su6]|uniref:DNA sulfur modification protein DndB n=1 Tax=Butyrivibrio sp. Su6 TaxID=1520810 RepID=UPI00089E470A|nr:DNA sulfur modification protein DndB [Butyrivibrio sp. Su6]SEF62245.1 DNA sulfur modification protein DndB [Butyrivibrio sp. Su6]